jgi:beta-lactamase class A
MAAPRAKPLVAALLLVATLSACATARRSPSPLDVAVGAAERRCVCRIGIAARHLESGRSYAHNGDAEFESASVIKIAVLTEAIAEAREGSVRLEERWNLTEANKADGSGVLLMLDAGLAPTWNDLATLMIGPSDNTAANAWIDRLGIDRVNSRMDSLGFHRIRLLARIPDVTRKDETPSPWKGFRLGLISPNDVAEWMSRVASGTLLDPDSSRQIFEYLDKDPSRLRIARRFSPEMLWAGKTGTMSGVRNDSGILRTKKGRFVLVIFTEGSKAEGFGADHPVVLAMAELAKRVVDEWSKDLPDIVEKPE